MAELLHELGDVSPKRVWMHPLPGMATEQDVLAAEVRHNRLCELVDGVLVEKGMGYYESCVAAVLIGYIREYLRVHNVGSVAAPDGTIRLAPGLVRIPDVSFTRWERLPNHRVSREPIPDLAPDLVVEILSGSNAPGEMQRKLREYFAAGVRVVWYVEPTDRLVKVYTSAYGEPVILGQDDVLDGGSILPGFQVSIRKWFVEAEQGGS